MMAVVAILGLLAALAVPNLTDMARHYRGVEASRVALAAFSQGRALSQRENLPVELAILSNSVETRIGVPSATFNPESARRSLDSFALERAVAMPGVKVLRVETLVGAVVTATEAPGATTVVRFCPGSDGYFRIGATEAPVCTTGDLASRSVRVVFEANGETFNIRLRAPLAAIDLRQGAT